MGRGRSSLSTQTVLRHFEVTDTKSFTSSNPPRCFVSGCGDQELPRFLWDQLFSLTLPGANLVLLEFLLQLCFLADIKPTWATKPPSTLPTLLTSGESKSQERVKFQRNGHLQLGLTCSICSNSTFSWLWFSSPALLLLLQDLHPLPSPRPSPLVHTKSCPGWTRDPR